MAQDAFPGVISFLNYREKPVYERHDLAVDVLVIRKLVEYPIWVLLLTRGAPRGAYTSRADFSI